MGYGASMGHGGKPGDRGRDRDTAREKELTFSRIDRARSEAVEGLNVPSVRFSVARDGGVYGA